MGGAFVRRTHIKNNGKNNCLILEKGCRIYDSQIQFFGENNTVKIEHDCVLKNVDIWISDGGIIEVGHNTQNFHVRFTFNGIKANYSVY